MSFRGFDIEVEERRPLMLAGNRRPSVFFRVSQTDVQLMLSAGAEHGLMLATTVTSVRGVTPAIGDAAPRMQGPKPWRRRRAARAC